MKRLEKLGVSPAPWQATCNDTETTTWVFSRATTADVATVCSSKREQCNADARLIAAAPELYEALCEAVTERCRRCVNDGDYCSPEDGYCFVQRWRKALEKAGG